MYHAWITKEKVFNFRSLYSMSGSSPEEKVLNMPRLYVMSASKKQNFYTWGVYISCVDPQIKYFKNSESTYNVLIT